MHHFFYFKNIKSLDFVLQLYTFCSKAAQTSFRFFSKVVNIAASLMSTKERTKENTFIRTGQITLLTVVSKSPKPKKALKNNLIYSLSEPRVTQSGVVKLEAKPAENNNQLKYVLHRDQSDKVIMPVVNIKNVLVCDAVDSACVDLLKSNGINVSLMLCSFIKHTISVIFSIG